MFEIFSITFSVSVAHGGNCGIEPNPAPLPGALALFAGGLDLVGFTGLARRRKTRGHPLTTV